MRMFVRVCLCVCFFLFRRWWELPSSRVTISVTINGKACVSTQRKMRWLAHHNSGSKWRAKVAKHKFAPDGWAATAPPKSSSRYVQPRAGLAIDLLFRHLLKQVHLGRCSPKHLVEWLPEPTGSRTCSCGRRDGLPRKAQPPTTSRGANANSTVPRCIAWAHGSLLSKQLLGKDFGDKQ